MPPGVVRGVDLVALLAATIASAMAAAYVAIVRAQGDGEPLAWVVILLATGAALAAYGALFNAPHRRAALILAAVELTVLGFLALLSIGLPILLAAAIAAVASARTPTPTPAA